jgi:aminoglycoside phosphotransferase (APT) family kinase protein
MQSRTKVPIARAEIEWIARKDFGSAVEVTEITELSEGWFNAAYAITLRNPDLALVLKVAPPADLPVLTYERHCMEIELAAIAYLQEHTDIPVPKVYASELDLTRSPIHRKYFWMQKFGGYALSAHFNNIPKADLDIIYTQFANYQKTMNNLTGKWFGLFWEPNDGTNSNGFRRGSWYEAFWAMLSAILSDFRRFHVRIPSKLENSLSLLEHHRVAFMEVTVPKFVHWDLWEGNIFVHQTNEGYRIEGITDFERALWGDPVIEVQFSLSKRKAQFLELYGPEILASEPAKIRRQFYNLYLGTIMYLEAEPRAYPRLKKWAIRAFATNMIRAAHNALSR